MKEFEKYGKKETMEDLLRFIKNPEFVHFVGIWCPPWPGFRLCVIRLELTHFPPGSEKGKDFWLRIFEWGNFLWAIVSIPQKKENLMKNIAKECGVKIVKRKIHTLTPSGVEEFPLNNHYNVFLLENPSLYRITPEGIERLLKKESKEIKLIEEVWKRRN
jgi:hypothetical protein